MGCDSDARTQQSSVTIAAEEGTQLCPLQVAVDRDASLRDAVGLYGARVWDPQTLINRRSLTSQHVMVKDVVSNERSSPRTN